MLPIVKHLKLYIFFIAVVSIASVCFANELDITDESLLHAQNSWKTSHNIEDYRKLFLAINLPSELTNKLLASAKLLADEENKNSVIDNTKPLSDPNNIYDLARLNELLESMDLSYELKSEIIRKALLVRKQLNIRIQTKEKILQAEQTIKENEELIQANTKQGRAQASYHERIILVSALVTAGAAVYIAPSLTGANATWLMNTIMAQINAKLPQLASALGAVAIPAAGAATAGIAVELTEDEILAVIAQRKGFTAASLSQILGAADKAQLIGKDKTANLIIDYSIDTSKTKAALMRIQNGIILNDAEIKEKADSLYDQLQEQKTKSLQKQPAQSSAAPSLVLRNHPALAQVHFPRILEPQMWNQEQHQKKSPIVIEIPIHTDREWKVLVAKNLIEKAKFKTPFLSTNPFESGDIANAFTAVTTTAKETIAATASAAHTSVVNRVSQASSTAVRTVWNKFMQAAEAVDPNAKAFIYLGTASLAISQFKSTFDLVVAVSSSIWTATSFIVSQPAKRSQVLAEVREKNRPLEAANKDLAKIIADNEKILANFQPTNQLEAFAVAFLRKKYEMAPSIASLIEHHLETCELDPQHFPRTKWLLELALNLPILATKELSIDLLEFKHLFRNYDVKIRHQLDGIAHHQVIESKHLAKKATKLIRSKRYYFEGAAGVGKTEAVKRLGKVLNLPIAHVNFHGATVETLIGSSINGGNPNPGRIIEAFLASNQGRSTSYSNMILVIDKADTLSPEIESFIATLLDPSTQSFFSPFFGTNIPLPSTIVLVGQKPIAETSFASSVTRVHFNGYNLQQKSDIVFKEILPQFAADTNIKEFQAQQTLPQEIVNEITEEISFSSNQSGIWDLEKKVTQILLSNLHSDEE